MIYGSTDTATILSAIRNESDPSDQIPARTYSYARIRWHIVTLGLIWWTSICMLHGCCQIVNNVCVRVCVCNAPFAEPCSDTRACARTHTPNQRGAFKLKYWKITRNQSFAAVVAWQWWCWCAVCQQTRGLPFWIRTNPCRESLCPELVPFFMHASTHEHSSHKGSQRARTNIDATSLINTLCVRVRFLCARASG